MSGVNSLHTNFIFVMSAREALEHLARTGGKISAGPLEEERRLLEIVSPKIEKEYIMPLSPDQLAKSREILLEKRAALANQVEILAKEAADSTEATENSKAPVNSAENASDVFDQDFAFMSMESEEELLRKVDRALVRIREQTYGECEECEEMINPERLEALPWATMCVKCQELEERGVLRRKRDDADFDLADDSEEALIGDDNNQA